MIASLHVLGLAATAAVSLWAARWVRGQTSDDAGTAMVLLLLVHAGMAALLVGHVLATGRTIQVAFFQLQFLLGLFAPVLWLLLAVYYTGRQHWLTRPVRAALVGSAVVVGALWITDPLHGLMVTGYEFHTQPFAYVEPEFTALAFTLTGLINVLTIFAFGLFLRLFLFSRRSYRWQTAAMLGGIAVIFVLTGLSGSSYVPARGFAYGVYGAGAFGAVVALALFRTRMFAVLPMARDAVFESIDDAIVIVDGERRIVDFNEPARELFPDVDDAVDVPLDEAYPGLGTPRSGSRNDGGGARAIVDRIDGSGDSPFAGTVEVTSGGRTRTLRVNVSTISSGGEPRGYALLMRDVTSLEEYATELEQKTVELEAKTDRLEQFASVLSHDLRNPVAVATGYVQHAVDTDEAAHAGKALEALERIDATIGNLLALSRHGETIDDPDVVALATLVDRAWETSDTEGATLSNEVPRDHRCRADPERLQTLLENLFRNAVDHGGDAVRVGLLEEGFFVADDGPGVPPDDRERIFEYGYSTAQSGTGLGLAIARGVADAHGWHLGVTESETGGARFEVDGVDAVQSVAESPSS